MKYITANEVAKKWGITQRRVQILCSQNRINDIFKLGENWAIPETAAKPVDRRIRREVQKNGEK